MSQRFKYIIITILLALAAVFVFQLFWLKGLFESLEGQMRQEVIKSIEQANLEELDSRITTIEKSGEKEGMTINFTSTMERDDPEKKTKPQKTTINGSDTIHAEMNTDFSLKDMGVFLAGVNELIHQSVDSIKFVNIDTLAYFVRQSLDQKGIDATIYKIEVMDLAKDSLLHTKEFVKTNSREDVFEYNYDTTNQLIYRLHTESLTKNILTQMIGILTSTFLILLLLIIAFWYLIKTILNQKTLDEMKDDFTNNMTHELKTPIAVAYAANDALLNFGQGENKEKREKYLQISRSQLEKLSTLVEQILSMSMELRTNLQLNKQELLLKDIIDYQVEYHTLKTTKKISFDIDINPSDLKMFVDKEHFNNIISNFLDNAIKYGNQEVQISIKSSQDKEHSVIEIADNGIGIAKDKQKYIFDKFYRVPQGNRHDAKGYGIGLFYVKSMVEKHGGTISVDSKLGRGTTFVIRLPLNK